MFHFNYYAPTQVVFGKDTEEKTGELVKAQNCKKVLIHYGSGSVKRTGLLDRVKQALERKPCIYRTGRSGSESKTFACKGRN